MQWNVLRLGFATAALQPKAVRQHRPASRTAFTPQLQGNGVIQPSVATNLQRAEALLQALLERASDGHGFADAFHLRGERGLAKTFPHKRVAF